MKILEKENKKVDQKSSFVEKHFKGFELFYDFRGFNISKIIFMKKNTSKCYFEKQKTKKKNTTRIHNKLNVDVHDSYIPIKGYDLLYQYVELPFLPLHYFILGVLLESNQ